MTAGEALVFEGADHSLMLGGDVESAIAIMGRLIPALRGFLGRPPRSQWCRPSTLMAGTNTGSSQPTTSETMLKAAV